MAVIGEGRVCPSRDHQVGQRERRNTRPDRGKHGEFGRLAVANCGPALEPAFEDGKLGRLRRGRRAPGAAPRRSNLPRRGARHEQSDIDLLLIQHGKDIAKGGQDGQTLAPAVAVASTEQRRLTHNLNGRHAGRELSVHRLGDDEAEIVGQTVLKPVPPVRRGSASSKLGRTQILASRAHLDGAGRHVVGPEIKGAAACEVKPGVVPVTGQNAVLDASAVQGKAHVRTAVVQGKDAVLVMHDEHWAMRTVYNRRPLAINSETVPAGTKCGLRGFCVHGSGARPCHNVGLSRTV